MRTVRSDGWTAVAERDETLALLADRVHTLLERHRLTTLARRSLASVEFAGDGIAIVDPDGDVQFASRSFAMQFGSNRDALTGTPWRALFTDAAVSHLESAALPTVAEDGGGPVAVPVGGKRARRSRFAFASAASRTAVWCSRSTKARKATGRGVSCDATNTERERSVLLILLKTRSSYVPWSQLPM